MFLPVSLLLCFLCDSAQRCPELGSSYRVMTRRQQDSKTHCSCLERTVLRAFLNYSSVEEEEKEEAEERDVNLIRL